MHYTSAPDRDLEVGDTVALVYKGATYICTVHEHYCKIKYFLSFVGGNNSIPLCAAFGADYKRTVADIYGYTSDGDCPQAQTLSDLTRLVRAMFARCDEVETQRTAPGILCLDGVRVGAVGETRGGQRVTLEQVGFSEEYPYRWSHDSTQADGASSIWGQRNNDIIRILSNGPEAKPEPKRVEVRVGMLIRGLKSDDEVGVVLDAKALRVVYRHWPDGCPQILVGSAEVRWPWEPESAWRRVDGRPS